MKNKETFSYTYSAKEQEEIKKIREKYIPKETDKMEQLRRLDESVTKKGTVISLVIGIIGALILGTGMSMCMVWTELFVLGIIVGIVGIVMVSAAYPLYSYVTKKEREKIAPEIIRLTDELMK
jgi:uncharacterized membrane protein YeaQ/YmgE (transglycosylase-associated protein family)